jgi:hypothetical protein
MLIFNQENMESHQNRCNYRQKKQEQWKLLNALKVKEIKLNLFLSENT